MTLGHYAATLCLFGSWLKQPRCVCLARGSSSHELFNQLVKGLVGDGDHLVVGAVLDGVFHPDGCRVEAERFALHLRPVDELDGGDEDGRNAAAFQISDVVHTARRATASIG